MKAILFLKAVVRVFFTCQIEQWIGIAVFVVLFKNFQIWKVKKYQIQASPNAKAIYSFFFLLHVFWLIHIFLVGCWIGNAHYIIPYKNILYIGKLLVWTLPNFAHILTLYLYFNTNNNNNNVNSLLERNKLNTFLRWLYMPFAHFENLKNIENVDKNGESSNPDIS